MSKASARVTIKNRLGLHARPAMELVDQASLFACTLTIQKVHDDDTGPVDGKSIMQVMMLAATQGTELEIHAEGDDAEKAVAALKALVDRGFGEE